MRIGEAALRLLQLAGFSLIMPQRTFRLETLADEDSLTPSGVETFLNAYLDEGCALRLYSFGWSQRACGLQALSAELSARKLARERASKPSSGADSPNS